MRKRRTLLALLAAAAVAAAVLGALLWPSGEASVPRLHGNRFVLTPAAKRKALPVLAGPALTPPPESISLRSPLGTPAFIDVWASWCVPCREEAPTLARLWRAYRTRVRFLGIDIEDTRGEARAFVRRYGLGYPSIFDARASLATKLGFLGLPTAYLVDRQGRIAATLVGKQEERTLRAGLEALVRESRG